MTARPIAPATGKLGVLTPGMGAVSSTFIAGVIAARHGISPPIGSVSQMAHIRLGTKEENRNPLIREFVPLAELDDIVFGGWDPISPNALEAAKTAGVLEGRDLDAISSEMEGIVADGRRVRPALGVAASTASASRTSPTSGTRPMALIDDIATFKEENGCDRLVMVWCGSTEAYQEPSAVHATRRRVRAGPAGTTTTTSRRARSTPTPRSSPTCPTPTAPRTSRPTSPA